MKVWESSLANETCVRTQADAVWLHYELRIVLNCTIYDHRKCPFNTVPPTDSLLTEWHWPWWRVSPPLTHITEIHSKSNHWLEQVQIPAWNSTRLCYVAKCFTDDQTNGNNASDCWTTHYSQTICLYLSCGKELVLSIL